MGLIRRLLPLLGPFIGIVVADVGVALYSIPAALIVGGVAIAVAAEIQYA